MRKKILVLLCVLSLTSLTACGEKKTVDTPTEDATVLIEDSAEITPTATPSPTPVSENIEGLYPAYVIKNDQKLYGYVNASGSFEIEPKYSTASDFSDGVAIVTDKETYKFIDTKGSVLYTVPDDMILYSSSFSNGLCVFLYYNSGSSKFGYIDASGKVILEAEYDQASDFREDGTAFVVKDNLYAKIDKSGEILDSFLIEGKKYPSVFDFTDGYIIYTDENTMTVGVDDYKGNTVIAPIVFDKLYTTYYAVKYLGNDLFAVCDTSKSYLSYEQMPYAIFNNKGEQLTEYAMYDISNFVNGYASITDDTHTFFIDTFGKEVTSLPKVEGRGSLTLQGNVIKAEIDNRLSYLTKDNTLIWSDSYLKEFENGITLTEVKVKPNKFTVIYYPVLNGLSSLTVQNQINEELKNKFTESRMELSEDDETTVNDYFKAEILGNLLIINHLGYDYPFGAAHGMPISDYYHIDLTTGQFYTLADLFKEDVNYVDIINPIILHQIEEASKQEDNMYYDDFSSISSNQPFHLTKEGILVYFYPYEIAPYAAGFPEFFISYDELKDFINYEGNLYKSIQ